MLLHFNNSLHFKAAYSLFVQKPFPAHWAMAHFILTRLTKNVPIDALVNWRQNLVHANRALEVQVGNAFGCHPQASFLGLSLQLALQ